MSDMSVADQGVVREGGRGPVIRIGRLTIDKDLQGVEVEGKHVSLTDMQYQLLVILADRSGPVSWDTMKSAWHAERTVWSSTNLIRVTMCNLRKRLNAAGCPGYIGTVRGLGYDLCGPTGGDRRM